jgi:hypothetical protein
MNLSVADLITYLPGGCMKRALSDPEWQGFFMHAFTLIH